VEADKSMLSRFFAAEGISLKKTVHASERIVPTSLSAGRRGGTRSTASLAS
jgi:hypothetical protein